MLGVHRSEKDAKKLTWEGLRTHEYLKELYDSIPGLKRSPDPYDPGNHNDLSVAEDHSEEAVSSETSDPLDNTEELDKMDRLFNSLDWKGKLAYVLTLGYGTYPYQKGKYPSANVSHSTSESSRLSTQEGFGRFLPYGAAKQYSVSFEGDELSRLEVAELYIKPIFGRDGVTLKEHVRKVHNPFFSPADRPTLYDESDVEIQLQRLVHIFLSTILRSILSLHKFQNRLTKGALKFLVRKEMLRESVSKEVVFTASYKNNGGYSLRALGLNVRPDLVLGLRGTTASGRDLGVIAASFLGEVKFCTLELRTNFRNVKQLLDERNSVFIRAVLAEEIPDLEPLANQTGQEYQRTHARVSAGWPSFTDDDILTTGLLRDDFFKAVKLYSIITKLVMTGVHAGVARVLLMDFNDYLFIELDRGFIRDVRFCTDEYFPEIVNCRYALFHRSEEFIKLLIIGWSLPTKEYTRDIEQFRKAVEDVSVIELREKIDALDLGGERSIEKRASPAHPPRIPSASCGGTLVTVPEEDVEDPDQSFRPASGGPSSSSRGQTSYQPESEANRRKTSSQMAEESSENAQEMDISQSDIDTHSSSPSSPTDTKRRKIGPQIDEPKILTPSSSSSTSSKSEYFIFNEARCEYYSCVILADALVKYVRHNEGYNSQTVLVDTGLFSKYICNANKVFDDPLGKSLLKVYDPYWADNSGADPEDAFYHFNPILSNLSTTELRAYEKLSPLMGELIPTLYAYGTMLDVSVMVGQAYSRFTGPFLLMEHFKKKESFGLSDVDEGFVKNKIIPAFKRLHSLGVVHNDIKWSNMVVTEDGDFKIIDFSHSVITDEEDKFKTEIDNIWSWFKNLDWYES